MFPLKNLARKGLNHRHQHFVQAERTYPRFRITGPSRVESTCEIKATSTRNMMTSSNGNFFCVIGHLWGESTDHRWIPLTKASDVERWWPRWCLLWSAPEQTAKKNPNAGDLRRHGADYDDIIMKYSHVSGRGYSLVQFRCFFWPLFSTGWIHMWVTNKMK